MPKKYSRALWAFKTWDTLLNKGKNCETLDIRAILTDNIIITDSACKKWIYTERRFSLI